jgi:alpha-beta hydrolase superfamily lysophospholipase
MTPEDVRFLSSDGTELFGRIFPTAQSPRATVVLIHGLGEQSSRYLHVGASMSRAGFRAAAFDLRGHGRSNGERGFLLRYDDFLDDVASAVSRFRRPGESFFLYAHSLGGQIAINYILRDKPPLNGAVIASPWIRLAFMPNPLKLFLAGLFRHLVPTFSQEADQDITKLSRDTAFLEALPDRDLNHRRVSARMYFEMLRGARMALDGAERFDVPLLMLHGTHDRVTSFSASEEFFARVKSSDKTFTAYPEGLHEMHNEICREEVLKRVSEWMAERCSKPTS